MDPYVVTYVTPPPAYQPLATLDQAKEYLGISKASEDELLRRLLGSISLQVERYTGKRFVPNPAFDNTGADTNTPATLTVRMQYQPGDIVGPQALPAQPWQPPAPSFAVALAHPVAQRIPHARALTLVQFGTITLAPAQWRVEHDSTLRDPVIRRVVVCDVTLAPQETLTVTGRFGIVPAPDDMVDAVLAMVARRYKEREARYGDLVQLPDGGVVNYFRQYPATVRATIDGYCELGA